MLEKDFEKHCKELEELNAKTKYYLTQYREKILELKRLGIQVETSSRGIIYYFPVIEIKYVDIMRYKL